MPESITDRPTKAHEYVFLLTKRERYYYDHVAVMEPCQTDEARWDPGTDGLGGADRKTGKSTRRYASGNKARKLDVPTRTNDHRGSSIPWEAPSTMTRNRRSVWWIGTEPYPEAHFATFPEKLVEPCILAGTKPGARVLDPFAGSGTTVAVAERLGRVGIGLELKTDYLRLAKRRTVQAGLL